MLDTVKPYGSFDTLLNKVIFLQDIILLF